MKIGEIVKIKQPDTYKKLKSKKENLTFKETEKLMQHDSYKRNRHGAIVQRY